MLDTIWLRYFEGNVRTEQAPAATLYDEVPSALRAPLVASLGRFQLGESAGGRLHGDVQRCRDSALNSALRRAVQLYIEEEWRHGRELAAMIRLLGGQTQRAHWSVAAFTACRRLLGLRIKMLTLAVAEVVGIIYYRALAVGVGSPSLAKALQLIVAEESRHLDFQAAFFARVVRLTPRPCRTPYRWLLRVVMFALLALALLVLVIDHGDVLRRIGVRTRSLVVASCAELKARSFLYSSNESDAARPAGEPTQLRDVVAP
jgi:hypothetical protein